DLFGHRRRSVPAYEAAWRGAVAAARRAAEALRAFRPDAAIRRSIFVRSHLIHDRSRPQRDDAVDRAARGRAARRPLSRGARIHPRARAVGAVLRAGSVATPGVLRASSAWIADRPGGDAQSDTVSLRASPALGSKAPDGEAVRLVS